MSESGWVEAETPLRQRTGTVTMFWDDRDLADPIVGEVELVSHGLEHVVARQTMPRESTFWRLPYWYRAS